MAGADFAGQIKRLLADARRLVTMSRPAVLKAMGMDAVALVQTNFELGESPYGKAWPPPTYREGQPLRDSGRLMNSVTDPEEALIITSRGFEVGTDVIYAAPHNYGWEEKSIPQRQFLPDPGDVPPEWETSLEDAAQKALERAEKK